MDLSYSIITYWMFKTTALTNVTELNYTIALLTDTAINSLPDAKTQY